jgi:hypothetical protein
MRSRLGRTRALETAEKERMGWTGGERATARQEVTLKQVVNVHREAGRLREVTSASDVRDSSQVSS